MRADARNGHGQPPRYRLAASAAGRIASQSGSAGASANPAGTFGRGGSPLVVLLPAVNALALGLALGVTALTATGPLRLFPAMIFAAAALVDLAAARLNRLRICRRTADQAYPVLAAVAVPGLALLPWLRPDIAARLGLYSAGFVLAGRLALYALLGTANRHGRVTEPTAVVGAGTFGVHLAEIMLARPELGLRPVGFLERGRPRRDLPLPWLGAPEDLAEVVTRMDIQRVIICHSSCGDEDLVPIVRAAAPMSADVCVVPRLYELGPALPRWSTDEIWGIPLVPLRLGRRTVALAAKRAFDIVVAGIMLTLALPVLVVLAGAVRLQSGQRALFRQIRLTGHGRLTWVLKLRTLPVDADPDTSWTVPPQRATALGRWLRGTHLDELPQLANVLGGSMSLVGPRPERPHFAEQFGRDIQRYGDRTRMVAGMTGWAQVHGLNGDTSIVERARFDNQYIENWSLWLDVIILGRTLAGLLRAAVGKR